MMCWRIKGLEHLQFTNTVLTHFGWLDLLWELCELLQPVTVWTPSLLIIQVDTLTPLNIFNILLVCSQMCAEISPRRKLTLFTAHSIGVRKWWGLCNQYGQEHVVRKRKQRICSSPGVKASVITENLWSPCSGASCTNTRISHMCSSVCAKTAVLHVQCTSHCVGWRLMEKWLQSMSDENKFVVFMCNEERSVQEGS